MTHDLVIGPQKIVWSDELAFQEMAKLQIGKTMWPTESFETVNFAGQTLSANEVLRIRHWDSLRLFTQQAVFTTLLDIGCGIGIYDLLLSQTHPDATFYLLDQDLVDSQKMPMKSWEPEIEKYGFYNLRSVTEDAILSTPLNQEQFKFLTPDSDFPAVDVVISLWSWCWHYPVAVYLERVIAALKVGGQLVLDVKDVDKGNTIETISTKMNCKPFLMGKYDHVSGCPASGRYFWKKY